MEQLERRIDTHDMNELMREHIHQSEIYKEQTKQRLDDLQTSVDTLAKNTHSIVEAYETTQHVILVSTYLGKFIKFLGGVLLMYVAVKSNIDMFKKL